MRERREGSSTRNRFMQQRDLIDMLREVYQDQEPPRPADFEIPPLDDDDEDPFGFNAPMDR